MTDWLDRLTVGITRLTPGRHVTVLLSVVVVISAVTIAYSLYRLLSATPLLH